MMARPGAEARPLRPTTWVTRLNTVSYARNPWANSSESMPSTPTRVTSSKSRPLATIWVPTMMSYSWRAKPASSFSWASLAAVVSWSMRRMRASGKRVASSSSAFWVPKPRYCSLPPQPPAAVLVVDHGDAAPGALEHLPAVPALGHGLVAPAVEQQDGLPALGQVGPQGVLQGQADLPGVAGGQLGPHIHHLDGGQRL